MHLISAADLNGRSRSPPDRVLIQERQPVGTRSTSKSMLWLASTASNPSLFLLLRDLALSSNVLTMVSRNTLALTTQVNARSPDKHTQNARPAQPGDRSVRGARRRDRYTSMRTLYDPSGAWPGNANTLRSKAKRWHLPLRQECRPLGSSSGEVNPDTQRQVSHAVTSDQKLRCRSGVCFTALADGGTTPIQASANQSFPSPPRTNS